MFLSFHFTTHYAFDSIMLKYIHLYVFVFSTHQQRAFKLIFFIDSIRNFGKLWRHWKNTHNVRFFSGFFFLKPIVLASFSYFFLALWSIVIFPALITLIVSTYYTHYLSIYLFWILIWGHTWVTCWMHSKRITLSLSVFLLSSILSLSYFFLLHFLFTFCHIPLHSRPSRSVDLALTLASSRSLFSFLRARAGALRPARETPEFGKPERVLGAFGATFSHPGVPLSLPHEGEEALSSTRARTHQHRHLVVVADVDLKEQAAVSVVLPVRYLSIYKLIAYVYLGI